MALYPSECGKGQTQPDGAYVYACNACRGRGKVNKEICSWCYGLNTQRILEEMTIGARGQRYYALLKAFLSVQGKAMVDSARALRAAEKFTIIEVAYISLKFGLNFKATCEWLEETSVIRSGSYTRISEAKVKVRELHEETRKKYPELVKEKAS